MPPKKLPPPALQKGIIGKGPPVSAGGKKDSAVAVKKDSVSTPVKRPPASPLAAAKVQLPVQPPVKRPLPAPHASPPSSPLDDKRAPTTAGAAATTPAGPASPQARLPSGPLSPPAVALAPVPVVAAARAADEPNRGEEAVKQPRPPPTRPMKSVASPPGPKPPPSAPPLPPTASKEALPSPGALASVPPSKKEGATPAPASPSVSALQPTASAAAAAAPAPAPSPGPANMPAAAKEKVPPAPSAKKGPPVPLAKNGMGPSGGLAPQLAAVKEKTSSGSPAKNGLPISLSKQGATTTNLGAMPAAGKEGMPPAPPSKKGPPSPPAKSGTAGKSPTKTSAPKPAAATAASSKASAASAAAVSPTTSGFASTPAAGAGSGVAMRMKSGLVGVGPPPGALLKTAYPGKSGGGASPAVGGPPPKKEGPPTGAEIKTAPLQKGPSSPLPAATAAAVATEGKAADKPVDLSVTPAGRKEPGKSSSGRTPSLAPSAAPLCKVVDQTGQFVGFAHGPPPPLTAQDPSYPRHAGRRRGSGLWQSDRLAPEDPLPYSSRSILQRVSRRNAATGGTVTGGVQYLPPFGVPPGWNTLPGFFFPVPAWPPFFPGQTASTDYPAKPMRSSRRRSSSMRTTDKHLSKPFKSRLDQSVTASAAPAFGEQYYPQYYYGPTGSHPFFAYPYYTAVCDLNPYYSTFHSQQQSQQLQGPPYYSAYPYEASAMNSPLPHYRRDRRRWRSGGLPAEASAGSVGSESSSSGEEDDPLRLTSKRTPTSGPRATSPASGLRGPTAASRRRTTRYASGDGEDEGLSAPYKKLQDEDAQSASSLEDITGTEEGFRQPVPYSQRRGNEDTYARFGYSDYLAALSPRSPARTFRRSVADTSVYGKTPWTRLEKKLNHIRGGYGLTGHVPPETLPSQAERQQQLEEDTRHDQKLVDTVSSRRASLEAPTSAAARRRSNLRQSWLRGLPADYAEDQRETEEAGSGDPYYKHFHSHYQRSKKPWVDEVAHRTGAARRKTEMASQPAAAGSFTHRRPRRGWDRWSFERGLTAPRRRTYQSLNELAAHFSHIEGEDQDELISLLLLCRRLEKQIEEQHLVIDMLEHELTTASATLKFPPEWRALEGIDLVSLVPAAVHGAPGSADSAFQPSAATPLFLKSTVLLPKQLPDGSSAFTGGPPAALAETAAGAPTPSAAAAAAPAKPVGAAKVSPPPAGAAQPAAPVKAAPSPTAGAAKIPTAAAAGATGGPKPPPPSVGVKKTLKPAGAVKPAFKTSIKAK